MSSQKSSGKAFEFSVLQSLREFVGTKDIIVTQDAAFIVASNDFAKQSVDRQKEDLAAGKAAMNLLKRFEPRLQNAIKGSNSLILSIQADRAGAHGDVRDILIASMDGLWEIGISAKSNHEALKHSRLSNTVDFGKKWFGISCSKNYFEEIEPIFRRLQNEKIAGLEWKQLQDKSEEIYQPVLNAFRLELLSLDKQNPLKIAPLLVSYLIGTNDFYKVIKQKNQTKIQVFNLYGSLNQPYNKTKPEIKLEKVKLPTRIVDLTFSRKSEDDSKSTLELICDGGWQLSFRVHNASTKVEPSLKFDINLIGHPSNLKSFTEGWQES